MARPVSSARKESRCSLKIDRWEWGYGFGINTTNGHLEGDYLDFRHLHVRGKLTFPGKAVRPLAEFTFVPSPLRELARGPYSSTGIGSMWFDSGNKRYLAVLPMPEDALSSVLAMLAANKLRFILLAVTPRPEGDAAILSYHFQAGIDRSDMTISTTDYSQISRRLRTKPQLGRRQTGRLT